MTHIVRAIKKHPPIAIRNALGGQGYSTRHYRHCSLEKMLGSIPRPVLLAMLNHLKNI